MAVEHLSTLLCDYAFEDAQGKRGYLGVFQNLDLAKAPGSIPQFYVAMQVKADAGDSFRISIANADRTWEELVIEGPVPPMEVPAGQSYFGFTFVGQLTNFEFPRPGTYHVLLSAVTGKRKAAKVIHAYPFSVRVKEGGK